MIFLCAQAAGRPSPFPPLVFRMSLYSICSWLEAQITSLFGDGPLKAIKISRLLDQKDRITTAKIALKKVRHKLSVNKILANALFYGKKRGVGERVSIAWLKYWQRVFGNGSHAKLHRAIATLFAWCICSNARISSAYVFESGWFPAQIRRYS